MSQCHFLKLFVAAGQQTDKGREARPDDVGEPVRSVESAGKIRETVEKQAQFQ